MVAKSAAACKSAVKAFISSMFSSEIVNKRSYAPKLTGWGSVLVAVVLFCTGLTGYKSENPYVVKINSCIKELDWWMHRWMHNGWGMNKTYSLWFEEKNAILRRGKFRSGYSETDKVSKSAAGWTYSEAYIDKPNHWLEKPEFPEYINTGFRIPVTKIDYKELKLTAKKVIPSQEDKMADWPYPIPPVIKMEIYSIDKKPDFSIERKYKSASGFYDSLIVQKVNKIDYYYPLYIRYHREIDGNPDKRYGSPIKVMMTGVLPS